MRRATWVLLLIVACAAITLALASGAVRLPWREVWRALLGVGDASTVAIVRELRLPRVVLGFVVGTGLAASGAALQTTLRNALAEPYLLGVSGGAAVGAVLAVVLGLDAPAVLPVSAFLGAAVSVALVLGVARAAGGRADPRMLLMAGVVVGAFCTAAIMVALATAPEGTVRGALWWMMGSLGDARWSVVTWVTAYVLVGGGLLLWWGRDLDVLSLGEDAAASLGLEVERTTRRVFLAASLLAAATVAGAGLIGFVGLVVPAMARALGARSARITIGAAALLGGTLVVLADLVARTALRPAELPLGAVTALVGVPFFLWRLRLAGGR